MPRDLRQLLEDTAVTPSAPVRPATLVSRGRRRRTRRQVAITSTIGAIAIFVAVNVLPLQRPPAEVILQPRPARPEPAASEEDATPSEAEDDPQAIGPELSLDALPELPKYGIAVDVEERVLLIGLDGKIYGHLPGTFDRSAFYGFDPAEQGPTHLLRLRVGQSDHVWLDPHGRQSVLTTEVAAPVQGGDVIYEAHAPGGGEMQLRQDMRTIARWPATSPWVVAPNHRLVTWWPCPDRRCEPWFFDSGSMERPARLPRDCWAAAVLGDTDQTLICAGGRSVEHRPDGTAAERIAVPRGSDGQPARATAVYGQGIVRVEHATCGIVEPLRIDAGALVPVLADGPSAPSAVPLGQLPDGRIIVHYNSDAACDAQSRQPGVFLYDPDTGAQQRVWSGRANVDAAQMWGGTSTGLAR